MSRFVFHSAFPSEPDGDGDPLSNKHKLADDHEKRRAQSAAFFVSEELLWVNRDVDVKSLTHAQKVLERTPILSNRFDPYLALEAIRHYRIPGWTADRKK